MGVLVIRWKTICELRSSDARLLNQQFQLLKVDSEEWSGRADLNCRPLAPQVEPFCGRERNEVERETAGEILSEAKDLFVNKNGRDGQI